MRPDGHPGVQDSTYNCELRLSIISDAIAVPITCRTYQGPIILSINRDRLDAHQRYFSCKLFRNFKVGKTIMDLGSFSISLGVKDLGKSKTFYEALGFVVFAGEMQQNFLILKNGDTVIGLFQGMFEGPVLTFNPGWDQSADELDDFTDVRQIKQTLKDAGMDITQETGGDDGPASFTVIDPDGYPVLIDQHR